ncbi:hypothetical protein ACFQ5N_04265 [Lutibacter holmesii]|uniref:Uncharacterized protein n=1 Tax=Lutibacter holmesii TaxID=1137985 RepID=A0ABW3WKU3_9FLAO
MKLQILPNWCKKLGLAIFFIGTIVGGYDDFKEGFTEGYNSTRIKEQPLNYKPNSFLTDNFGEIGLHIFEIIGVLGMLIYMLSKEKIEDDYIHKLRYESYLLSSILWLVIAIIAYSFNENLKLSIDYFIYLFIWTYLITFFIKKRIY